MAVVNNHKSFEQSLRSASTFAPLLRPIKSEIHKGCTGKAHGCGTRKNIRTTYSSLSDSSSDVSPAPSVERGSSEKRTTVSRKKDPDTTTTTSCESLPKGVQRNDSIKSNKSNSRKGSDSKPPWHNVYTAKLTGLKVEPERSAEAPDRTTIRKTRRIAIHWQDLYEKALNQKLYGGQYIQYSYVAKPDPAAVQVNLAMTFSHPIARLTAAISYRGPAIFLVKILYLPAILRMQCLHMRLYKTAAACDCGCALLMLSIVHRLKERKYIILPPKVVDPLFSL